MDSVANGRLHAGRIQAFASSSTLINASMPAVGRGCGHGRAGPFAVSAHNMIKNCAKRPLHSLPSPPFSILRGDSSRNNWLEKISHMCSSQLPMVIATEQQSGVEDYAVAGGAADCSNGYGCRVDDGDSDSDGESVFQFYAESFSKLLRRVSLADVKMYAELCYLGNLTYHIPKIKEENLLSCTGTRFVTSHLEMHSKPATTEAGDLNIKYSTQGMVCDPQGAHFPGNSPDKVNDATSQPCGWYICDHDKTGIRYFVIQGSESIASWQANVRFEPVQFEDRDVLVHRGVYEVAKGIYEQLLPEARAHLKSSGRIKRRPLIRFIGHSLGGSIATLLNLMLLIRAEAPISALLPVVTYGSPFIMCGGQELMLELGLPKDHIQGIALHRDIVPRAFSVTLPGWLIDIVKAINASFRTNPCLDKQRLMYMPMGELLILQPEESFSPPHHLLPPGPGLYLLTSTLSDTLRAERVVKSAQRAFLDYPYPMEILKNPSAYGWEGTIVRDHDMNSYLKCLHDLINYEQTQIKKMGNRFWWPPLALQNIKTRDENRVTASQPKANNDQGKQGKLANILKTTRESMKGLLRDILFHCLAYIEERTKNNI